MSLFTRTFLPYDGNAKIPVIKISAEGENRGMILIHGGFDAFLEEWYFMMKYLSTT